jgi:hypothetical protein
MSNIIHWSQLAYVQGVALFEDVVDSDWERLSRLDYVECLASDLKSSFPRSAIDAEFITSDESTLVCEKAAQEVARIRILMRDYSSGRLHDYELKNDPDFSKYFDYFDCPPAIMMLSHLIEQSVGLLRIRSETDTR